MTKPPAPDRGEMAPTAVHAVTGPFSYTGRHIADRLRRRGATVRGLVRRPPQAAASGIDCRELQFTDRGRLIADLRGVEVLHNTYWIRCPRGDMTFEQAVANTRVLADAAAAAGVQRIVHLSVSNPAAESPFAYFRGKAAAERAVSSAGVPVSVIRPTLIFGRGDILINNIAWLLRRLRMFAMPSEGRYRVQPVYVGDVADLALREATWPEPRILDAAGPEVLSFAELVGWVAASLPVRTLVVPAPRPVARLATDLLSRLLGDVLVTPEELGALMVETLVSSGPPTAPTRFSTWLRTHGRSLGLSYSSEIERHWR